MVAIQADVIWVIIRQLGQRGIPIVAWTITADADGRRILVLISEGGRWVEIPIIQLTGPIEYLVEQLGTDLPRYGQVAVPNIPGDVPRLSDREWSWFRFLRWLAERAWFDECAATVAAGEYPLGVYSRRGC